MMQPTAVIVSHSALIIADWRLPCPLQAVKGIRPDRRTFPGWENQHFSRNRLSFQLVAALDHHPALRIDTAEEGYPHAA